VDSLTPKQQKIFNFIKLFLRQNGYAPTLQDMAQQFQLSSLGTVQQYLEALEAKGYIERSSKARGLKLIEKNEVGLLVLPVLGKVAAGRPLEYKKNGESREVPAWMVQKRGDHFLLQVQGDSMIDEGILEGDYIIVHRQSEAESGQIVVAMLDEEATVKKFVWKRSKVELHSANPRYAPIVVPEDADFHIEGLYCGILRVNQL
jgi:repressor LexA